MEIFESFFFSRIGAPKKFMGKTFIDWAEG